MEKNTNIGSKWANLKTTDSTYWKKVYNQSAANYDSYMEECNYQAPKSGAKILEGFVPKESRILDVACGTGLTGLALRAKGYDTIVGIDISDLMLEQARKKNIYTALHQVNLEDKFLFPTNGFNAIFAMGVMTQIAKDKIADIFKEFCRVVSQGGYIIFNHRDDLYTKAGYDKEVQKLVDESFWEETFISESQLYLPAHAEYSDKITTRYFVYKVL